jgi:hypothetical protein
MQILVCDCGDCDSWIVANGKLICQTCGKEIPIELGQIQLPEGVKWDEREVKFGAENAFTPTKA